MRPVISYDDITAPQPPPAPQLGPQFPSVNPPPAKKRKTNQSPANGRPPQQFQHWDDPGSSAPQMSYDDTGSGEYAQGGKDDDVEEGEEQEQEESRELTYEEIWDDSALVDAWDSAMAEYKAFHGPGSKWKEEPVKKSPLWYNVPPKDTGKKAAKANVGPSTSNGTAVNGQHESIPQGDHEIDSAPLNFDTYVPSHDPSLASAIPSGLPAVPVPDYSSYHVPLAPGQMVSQDEAFSRALSAMYWGGYWSAVYHCQRQSNASSTGNDADGEEGDEGEIQGEDDVRGEQEVEDMLPAQR